jgi:hypothetical protein
MVLAYRRLVDDEIDWYTHDQGVAEVIGDRDQDMYDEIEDALKDQLYNKGVYEYLIDVAKREKDIRKAKEKIDKELEEIILEARGLYIALS